MTREEFIAKRSRIIARRNKAQSIDEKHQSWNRNISDAMKRDAYYHRLYVQEEALVEEYRRSKEVK